MKTINITSLLVAIIICTTLFSCKKESYQNVNIGNPPPPPEVISSNWFYGDVQEYGLVKDAPELTMDILSKGKVLVFAKGGFDSNDPTILPSRFDANYIGIAVGVGRIKFIIEGTGVISPSIQFRYILIPADEIVPDNKLDYNNYNTVCNYYNISE